MKVTDNLKTREVIGLIKKKEKGSDRLDDRS